MKRTYEDWNKAVRSKVILSALNRQQSEYMKRKKLTKPLVSEVRLLKYSKSCYAKFRSYRDDCETMKDHKALFLAYMKRCGAGSKYEFKKAIRK